MSFFTDQVLLEFESKGTFCSASFLLGFAFIAIVSFSSFSKFADPSLGLDSGDAFAGDGLELLPNVICVYHKVAAALIFSPMKFHSENI